MLYQLFHEYHSTELGATFWQNTVPVCTSGTQPFFNAAQDVFPILP